MGRKKSLWLIGGGAALLIVFIAVLWMVLFQENKSREEAQGGPAAGNSTSEVHLIKDENPVWEEARSWSKAAGDFPAGTNKPVLLAGTDDMLLYVHSSELRYIRKGREEESLVSFGDRLQLRMWKGTKGILLGGTPEAVPLTEEPVQYPWYYIRLTLEENKGSSAIAVGSNFIPPADVVKVEAAAQPELLVLHTLTNGHLQSAVITPGSDQVRYIGYFSHPEISGHEAVADQALPGEISDLQSHPFIDAGDQTIYSFSNKEGTLVYRASPVDNISFYRGLRYDSPLAFPVDGVEGVSRYAVLLQSDNGGKYMAYPNEYSLFPWSPMLQSPGWKSLNSYLMYRLSDSRIETIAYNHAGGLLESHESGIAIDQLEPQSRSGTRFDFINKADRSKVQLSLYDLSNIYTPNPQLENLRIRDLPAGTPVTVKKLQPHPYYEERTVPFSKGGRENFPSNVPAALKQELEDLHNQGSGDGWGSTTFYEEKGTWYVLQFDQLFRFVPERKPLERLEQITPIPVGYSCSVNQASACRTAEGMLRAEGSWFIADTYNDRILRLNDEFAIIDEANLPLPNSISLTGNKKLVVESFSGTFTYDLELKLTSKQEKVEFTKVPAGSQATASISPASYYEDKSSGLLWYYESGYVHQYRKQDDKIRSYYVSHLENGRGTFKILPYQDRIIAFSDHRLLQFRQNDGGFLQSVRYDRVQPDGIYDTTSFGESSYALDQSAGRLYLVQGYRILMIDLESGKVSEVFRESNTDIGEIVIHQNSLIFTLQPGGRWAQQGGADQGVANQLIRLKLDNGQTARYAIPGYYYSGQLSGEDIILREFSPSSTDSKTGLRIPLANMK